MRWVVALNLGYFGIEFAVANAIGSVALFADSIDFLEDSALNLLALLALGWSATRRTRVGYVLALLLLVPGALTLWQAWRSFDQPVVPDSFLLTIAGTGALIVNVVCAYLLARYRDAAGSLTRAAFLSARNDAIANVAIIVAGALTAVTFSHWPDLIVGLGIFLLNLGAAAKVFEAARREQGEPSAAPSP